MTEKTGFERGVALLVALPFSIAAELSAVNTEAEVAARLAEIRQAVAGEITDAAGLDAIRTALTAAFLRIELREDGEEVRLLLVLREIPVPVREPPSTFRDGEMRETGAAVLTRYAGLPGRVPG